MSILRAFLFLQMPDKDYCLFCSFTGIRKVKRMFRISLNKIIWSCPLYLCRVVSRHSQFASTRHKYSAVSSQFASTRHCICAVSRRTDCASRAREVNTTKTDYNLDYWTRGGGGGEGGVCTASQSLASRVEAYWTQRLYCILLASRWLAFIEDEWFFFIKVFHMRVCSVESLVPEKWYWHLRGMIFFFGEGKRRMRGAEWHNYVKLLRIRKTK